MMPQANETGREPLLDWRSGGWAIAGGALLALIFLSVFLWNAFRHSGETIGDGKNPETYGFDLSQPLVPKDRIVAGGMHKDGIPALTEPAFMTPAEVVKVNEEERGKYLVPTDRVIGIVIAGEARAYPLRVLNWHEVVNDTVQEVPIAVTYNPLCDSVVVFDRRVNGATLEFGVSGLLYNSNLLMYDRRPEGKGESLWSQLLFQAIAGPAAGQSLEILPCTVTHWQEWTARYPETKVIAPQPEFKPRYQRDPYSGYYSTEKLQFPVEPLPAADSLPLMASVLVLQSGEQQGMYAFQDLMRDDSSADQSLTIGGRSVAVRTLENPDAVEVTHLEALDEVDVIYAFWFAWHAMHPEMGWSRPD